MKPPALEPTPTTDVLKCLVKLYINQSKKANSSLGRRLLTHVRGAEQMQPMYPKSPLSSSESSAIQT
jgi:hypothetical protein